MCCSAESKTELNQSYLDPDSEMEWGKRVGGEGETSKGRGRGEARKRNKWEMPTDHGLFVLISVAVSCVCKTV